MKGVTTGSAAAASAAAGGVSSGAASREEEVRTDLISHFVLRLAYCRTSDLRKWFLGQECEMFRLKFGTYSAGEHVSVNATGPAALGTGRPVAHLRIKPPACTARPLVHRVVVGCLGFLHSKIAGAQGYGGVFGT